MAAQIRALEERDWGDVRRIYRLGIETRNATFETAVPDAEALDAKWIAGQRWVIEHEGAVAGWAAMTAVSARECYRGVGETSIYLDTALIGRGLGTLLIAHQVRAAQEAGFWTLQTSIFPENTASLALHRRAGFREVGCRERIAQLDGAWRDTILLELRA
ncbi:GNAT family N-acetyltransferase [Nocardioides sp. Kera G14]|uniref:GNAT family N-acetyltransferase n=1 Tax=Nocardioides sp. Kera G14 TaxID=2884264 RepID=UPI001D0FAD7A|nr:GNAT family N-acetyltransferase [Nocardioides sp. Kera G14]UDY24120.1 N-acetyltransferase family protein [Nocardioides sp. Kera G14]